MIGCNTTPILVLWIYFYSCALHLSWCVAIWFYQAYLKLCTCTFYVKTHVKFRFSTRVSIQIWESSCNIQIDSLGCCFKCRTNLTNVCHTAGHCVGLLSWSNSCGGWRQRTQLSSQLCHSLRYHAHTVQVDIQNVLCLHVCISDCVFVHARWRWRAFPDGQRDRGGETDSDDYRQTNNSSAGATGYGKSHIFG